MQFRGLYVHTDIHMYMFICVYVIYLAATTASVVIANILVACRRHFSRLTSLATLSHSRPPPRACAVAPLLVQVAAEAVTHAWH